MEPYCKILQLSVIKSYMFTKNTYIKQKKQAGAWFGMAANINN